MSRTETEDPNEAFSTSVSFILIIIVVTALVSSLAVWVDLPVFQAIKIAVAYSIMGGMVLVRT